MKTENLQVGMLIRVSKTVANPKPDRRVKDDWRYHTHVPEGTLFRVADRHLGDEKGTVLPSIHLAQGRYARLNDATKHYPLPEGFFETIIEASEPVPESVGTILAHVENECGASPDEILAMLVEDGNLTVEGIRRAAARLATPDEDEGAARRFGMKHEVGFYARSQRKEE